MGGRLRFHVPCLGSLIPTYQSALAHSRLRLRCTHSGDASHAAMLTSTCGIYRVNLAAFNGSRLSPFVCRSLVHPLFQPGKFDGDVAILVLEQPTSFTPIK